MLIPRYSLRWLLGLITFSAGVSLVLSYVVRGHAWAVGVAAGLWSLVAVALAYVAAFLVAWMIEQGTTMTHNRRRNAAGSSPFATQPGGDMPFASPSSLAHQPSAESPPPMTG
jgi:hypothetical protein